RVPALYAHRTSIRSVPVRRGATVYTATYYGGWSDSSLGWLDPNPPIYYYTPFSRAYYYRQPILVDGVAYPGGVNSGHVILGIICWLIVFVVVVMGAIYLLGGNRARPKYRSV